MSLSIAISPRRTLLALLVVIVGLVVTSTIAGALWFFLDLGESGFLIVQLFWVDSEANLPTLYSTFTLLIASCLLGVIAIAKRREAAPYAGHWGVLALVFTYLAADEGARIHERAVTSVHELLNDVPALTGRFFEIGPVWVVAAIPLVLVFAVLFLRFLLHLPGRIRNLMILSGAVFVAGAVGFEILSHLHAVVHGQETATYALLATIEEFLEMVGVALFIYTLLSYIGSIAPEVEVRIAPR